MKCDRSILRLYAVTDRAWTGKLTLPEQVEAALEGGATCVQMREKEMDDDAFLLEAREIARICRRRGVPFIVNDRVHLARACGADGVHVGQNDMSVRETRRRIGNALLLGASVHSVEEARRAVEDGADHLGVGAMFSTATKPNAQALPLQTLRDICAAVPVPVVAIGGITARNILALRGSGAAGAAVVSAIFAAPDPAQAARDLRRLADEMARPL